MPESLSAFCSIVSFTAANTNRMFDVSVACVKLRTQARPRVSSQLSPSHTHACYPPSPSPFLEARGHGGTRGGTRDRHSLWVHAQPRAVRLHEPPQNVLRRLVNVGPASVFRKYRSSGTFGNLLLNTSILFRNKLIDVRRNHHRLMTIRTG